MGTPASTHPDASGLKVAVVISRFNEQITGRLLDGAKEAFAQCGGDLANLTSVWVPGAFEIPAAAKSIAESGEVDGVLTLGVVIKGDTYHFEVISDSVARAIMDLTLTVDLPISFGVLTTYTLDQALDRSGSVSSGNKGAETMVALIESINQRRGQP